MGTLGERERERERALVEHNELKSFPWAADVS
jgi:hypothetical protein